MKRQTLILTLVTFVLLFASPLLARLGSWSQLASWLAPYAKPAGLSGRISLVIEEHVAYIDIFRLYPEHRIIITDGGYVYCHSFDIPSESPRTHALGCQVTWLADAVELQMPSGEKLVIPAKTLIEEIRR